MSWLINNFVSFEDKVAIVHKDKSFTYSQLFNNIERIKKNIIENRINSGEVVTIVGDYSFDNISLLLALYQNRNIIVPISSNLENEVYAKIQESFSTKSISFKSNEFNVINYIASNPHSMIKSLQDKKKSGLILFSSGSTGKPKAMIHNFDNLVNHYQDKKEKSMNMIVFLMFDHIGGLNTLLNILSMGVTMIIPENRNPDYICKLVQDYKIRVLPSSPTFLNLILMSKSHEKYDLKSLRMITYGTEVMPEALLFKLKDVFPKTKLLQTFGTSETGISGTSSKSSNSTFMKLDDPNVDYKIVNNELWLKSKTQVMGYLNSSMDSFTNDGWFKTGDLVNETDDGFIKIIGRNKELINVGGEKVLPNEVESVIFSMDIVEDVLVYGESNIITGQTVVCDIVVNIDIETKEAKKLLRKFCKTNLDGFKIPTKVNLVDRTNFSNRFKKIRRK